MTKKNEIPVSARGPAEVLAEIIRDLSFTLGQQREMGLETLEIPADAVSLMDGWMRGRFRPLPVSSHAKPPEKISSTATDRPSTARGTLDSLCKQKNAQQAAASTMGVNKKASPGTDFSPKMRVQGPADAKIFFLCRAESSNGEGRPDMTAGPAGELLLNILKAMHLSRDQVCLISFTPPDAGENIPLTTWMNAVKRQVFGLIKERQPRIICTMGQTAARVMLGETILLAEIAGCFRNMASALLMPTFHPRQLIQDPALKRPVWESMKLVMRREGL